MLLGWSVVFYIVFGWCVAYVLVFLFGPMGLECLIVGCPLGWMCERYVFLMLGPIPL